MDRTPLRERKLPDYTRGEEITNMVTHIVGAALSLPILIGGISLSAYRRDPWAIVGSCVYGLTMLWLYTMSSVYHGLPDSTGKRVMQVIDHCTIYALIAGSYTPILLSAIRPAYPALAWTILGCEWGLGLAAAALTAIDLKKYARASMICYIAMGWLIVLALRPTIETVGTAGFLWLLAGGLAYTVGAVLYGIGRKRRYYHSVFHVFVLLGSALQAVCILFYVL
ncbi:MAG: hemolysin III family protein [Oscillospiraceae bacterium]|nr:hemolysin III family protein [Oscillospiraceae bacterium]